MGFAVDWAPRAEDDLNRLPLSILQEVVDGVYQLAENPVGLSYRPTILGQVYQRYQFTIVRQGESFRVQIMFQYTQDEMAIEILGVVVEAF